MYILLVGYCTHTQIFKIYFHFDLFSIAYLRTVLLNIFINLVLSYHQTCLPLKRYSIPN